MRELKLKAWDKKNKNMLNVMGIMTYNNRDDLDISFKNPQGRGFFKKEDIELLGYTGEKDKSGTEIYNGDILKCLDNDENEYITTVRLDGGAYTIDVNQSEYDYTAIGWALENDVLEVERVGNKWENPELIKIEETKEDK
jgi:uncharacterized phage protein (TIGR01671 family)